MAYNQQKLKAAVATGFIPPEFKDRIGAGQETTLKVLNTIDQERVGVRLEVKNPDTHAVTRYIHWYTAEEIDEMLPNG